MYRHSVHNSILSAIYLPLVLTVSSVAIAIALAMGGQPVFARRTVRRRDRNVYVLRRIYSFNQFKISPLGLRSYRWLRRQLRRVLGLIESVPTVRDKPEMCWLELKLDRRVTGL